MQAMLCVGLVMVLAGELLRKSAMVSFLHFATIIHCNSPAILTIYPLMTESTWQVTARHSFTHTLHLTEHPTNELVKSGPYRSESLKC